MPPDEYPAFQYLQSVRVRLFSISLGHHRGDSDGQITPISRNWFRSPAAIIAILALVDSSSVVVGGRHQLRFRESWRPDAPLGRSGPTRCLFRKSLGACPGISIQVTSMDDQSVQIASIRPQCSFAPIPAA